jgi:hypothetical protein
VVAWPDFLDNMVLNMPLLSVTITHWFPIITFCPISGLPDLLYVKAKFDQFKELYGVRRKIKAKLRFRVIFMEDAAMEIKTLFPEASEVEVRLMFSKHIVKIKG